MLLLQISQPNNVAPYQECTNYLIVMDISKAFDTINKEILIEYLRNIPRRRRQIIPHQHHARCRIINLMWDKCQWLLLHLEKSIARPMLFYSTNDWQQCWGQFAGKFSSHSMYFYLAHNYMMRNMTVKLPHIRPYFSYSVLSQKYHTETVSVTRNSPPTSQNTRKCRNIHIWIFLPTNKIWRPRWRNL